MRTHCIFVFKWTTNWIFGSDLEIAMGASGVSEVKSLSMALLLTHKKIYMLSYKIINYLENFKEKHDELKNLLEYNIITVIS